MQGPEHDGALDSKPCTSRAPLHVVLRLSCAGQGARARHVGSATVTAVPETSPPQIGVVRRSLPWLSVALCACVVVVLASHPGFYDLAGHFVLAMLWLIAPGLFAAGLALQPPMDPEPRGRLRRRGRIIVAAVLLSTTGAVLGRVPLRLRFVSAQPGLERLVAQRHASPNWTMAADQRVGAFTISAARTNAWLRRIATDPRCGSPTRTIFVLEDDHESAFIHDANGIETLCYNAGAKGHVVGSWYSMKED